MKGAERAYYVKNPDDTIPREIGLRLACSLAIQLTTLQAASYSRYHVCQETSEGPKDRSARR